MIFVFGCSEKKFNNPFDPLANMDYKVELGYIGLELDQLRIDNSNIEERSFKCYEIYYSKSEGFTPLPENLFIRITRWDSTRVSISFLDENEVYYFVVKFVDILDRISSSEKLTVLTANKRPDKPTFSPLTQVNFNQLEIVWNASNIRDFQKYELYFSELKDFPVTPLNLYRTIPNISETKIVISNLKVNTEYYFRLRIYDTGNLFSESDEQVLKTGKDLPTPVTIEAITDETESSVVLHWSRNTDSDFLRYELHYSSNQNFVISSSTLYRSVTDQNTTVYTISGLSSLTKYYFKVRVVDQDNVFVDSKEFSGVTTAPTGPDVPNPVNIFDPVSSDIEETRVYVSWQDYSDPDFKGYEIHYSVDPNFIPSSSTIFIGRLSDITRNRMGVSGLTSSTRYYFTVRVVNNKDKFSDSRRVSATTK